VIVELGLQYSKVSLPRRHETGMGADMIHRQMQKALLRRSVCLVLLLATDLASGQGVLTAAPVRSALCSIAACQNAKPNITGFDLNSVFTPGGQFVLQGTNFNSADGQPGSIVLKIGNKPGVTVIHLGQQFYREPYVERQTTVLGWADSHVFGRIPADISGVTDGVATLEIQRHDGWKSAPFVIHFKATKDLQILPMTDVTVKTCATQGDTNLCNNWSDSSQLSIPANVQPTPSLYGSHALFIPTTSNDAISGQDVFTLNLQNGWAFDNSYWKNGIYTSGACYDHLAGVDLPSPSVPNRTVVSWNTTCNVQYHVSLYITGPKGVPWK
jgi:hypothetical protein